MADNEVIKEPAPKFDLGIENNQVYGNMQAADAFLSEAVTASTEDLEEVNEEEEELKRKAELEKQKQKQKPKDKPNGEELINSVLKEGEEDLENKEDKPKGDNSTFEALTEELYTAGVFTTEDGEDPEVAKTPEEFLELFNKEKNKGVSYALENFLSKHGEDRRELFDAIFVKGVDPSKYLPVYNDVQNFEGADLESESIQEAVVRSYYTRAGWDKAEVDSKVEKLKSYSDLEEEAKRVHPKILSQEKQKLEDMKTQSEQELQSKAAQDMTYRTALQKQLQEKLKTKSFDGIPLDEKQVNKAFDFMYTKKWKLPSGELLTDFDKMILDSKNPDNIADRIKMTLLKLNNFDFSKIEKKAITEKSNSLFSKLVKKDEKQPIDNSGWKNI